MSAYKSLFAIESLLVTTSGVAWASYNVIANTLPPALDPVACSVPLPLVALLEEDPL